MVYVTNGNRLNRKKMDEIRIGPFEIEKKISDSIYKINTGGTLEVEENPWAYTMSQS